MTRPRLLDLFCGAGGAAMGYYRAGFDVVGVDCAPQYRYPFVCVQADALEFLARNGRHFHAIHASPPCQGYTTMSNRYRGQGTVADAHPKLIDATRDALLAVGRPWIIENVGGAASAMRARVQLTGGMFGLGVHRPRLFESSVPLIAPVRVPAPRPCLGVYGARPDGRRLWTRADGSEQRAPRSLAEASDAMGVDWMTWRELAESIPPAYTEYVGRQLLQWLAAQALAA